MTLNEMFRELNNRVIYNGVEYILSAVQISLSESGYYGTAILKDLSARSSIITADLERVQRRSEQH